MSAQCVRFLDKIVTRRLELQGNAEARPGDST